jgi:trigger factor
VLNDKVSEAFSAAVSANKLRVAGMPRLEPRSGDEGRGLAFSAVFEIYPDIDFGKIADAEVQRAVCDVGETEVDKTIEIMRKQRAVFDPVERPAADGDRVKVDFEGTIDGTVFEGGSGTDFVFTLGEGRMLPEFEAAVSGMTVGQSRTFPLTFPSDYRASELAGKQAQFEVTVKSIEQPVLPAVDAEFAKALGVADGDVAVMREEIKANLEREVASRLKARTRDSVMNALLSGTSFEVPKSLVQADQERLVEMARKDLVARGIAQNEAVLPAEMFAPQAERRVRLGLAVSELVRAERLQAQQQQIRKAVENIAQSYERPAEVIQWYLGSRERLAEVETMVMEDNVVEWVLQRAKVADVPLPFDDLMGRTA